MTVKAFFEENPTCPVVYEVSGALFLQKDKGAANIEAAKTGKSVVEHKNKGGKDADEVAEEKADDKAADKKNNTNASK